MALRINTNISAINAQRNLAKTTLALNKTLQKLSTGLRINSAADDAAGLAIAESFGSQVRGTAVAQRNAQDGVNLLQTAEGALGESANILQRIRELAVQAANGTMSDTNRAALDAEVTQLEAQLDDISGDTEFNGISVLASATTITLQAGYKNGQTLTVGTVVAGTTQLLGAATGVSISSLAGAAAALTTIDAAINSVSTLRGTFGAQINRLEFTINTLAIQEENAAASESAIRDADIAKVTSQFTRNQILVTAGTSVLAQSNILPQTALQLIG